MIVRKIRPEEYKRCQQFCAACFEYPLKDPDKPPLELLDAVRANPQSRQEAHWDSQWAAFEDDDRTMLSTMTVIPWEARFDGHTVRMDGIGGVATLPEHRRRGGIRGCFERALPGMYADGAALSYLYPFSTAFYRKFGYAVGCDWTLWKIAMEAIPRRDEAGSFRLIERDARVLDDLRAVDRARQARYNLTTVSGDLEYRWAREAEPFAQREYSYIYYSAAGAPKGYVTYVPVADAGDRALDAKRFAYADREGLEGLLGLMKRLSADHSHALLRLPGDVSLKGVLPEWSFGYVRRSTEQRGMVRAVNVEKLLRLARARGSGALKIAVDDPAIPENSGCFEVRFAPDGENAVARTGEAPDIRMSIQAFSRMICGLEEGVDPEWQPGVELLCRREEAEKLFYRKPCFIDQYF